MRDIAVVQWSRLGDVLQTRGLLRALGRAHAPARLTLFADARYGEIAHRLPERPEFCPVNLSDWTGAARHASSQAQFLRRASDLLRVYDTLRFDDVYVLTRSAAAVCFANLLRAEGTHGYGFRDGRLIAPEQIRWLEDRWAGGLPAAVHLTDVWATLAPCHVVPEWAPALSWEKRDAADKRAGRKQVAILCDAGETYRRIPESWLAGLARQILAESQTRIVLLGQGAPSEDEELSALARSIDERVSDLRGRTNLSDLCARLVDSDLVIGPDTGGLHLAAALNLPVIGLYFGGAAAPHTGPYAARAMVLENPSWSVRERNGMAELIFAVLSRADVAGAASEIGILSPRLDDYGLVFAPCGVPALSHEVTAVRQKFFQRFARPVTAPATGVANGARMSDLTVIIPEGGATSYTDELLPDLERELGDEGEIILVCSGFSASRWAAALPKNARCVRVPESLTFAAACNLGARKSDKKWLLFLNNDTRLPSGMLQMLLSDADEYTLLSPLIRYPDGLIQNAGVRLCDEQVIEIGHGRRELEESLAPDALSAVALLMSRAAFDRLHGFDETYRNGYEDLDLCLRAAKSGFEVRVNTGAYVVHFRGSSQGRFNHEDSNRILFVERWRERLREPSPQGHVVLPAMALPELVIVSDEPIEAAGSRLRWVWPLERCGLRFERDFRWLRTSDGNLSLEETSRCLARARTVIVFRPLSSAPVRRALMECVARGGARLWVDSDDLFIGRFSGSSPRAQAWLSLERGFADLLTRADVITVSTAELQRHLHAQGFKATLLETVPSIHQLAPEIVTMRDDRKFAIGFFGTPSHLIDLGNVLPALETVLERHPHTWFYWWGCRPGELAYHPRVRQGGPAVKDYEAHLARLHHFGLDAAIVPLLNSPYARAKSPVKFFEYALAGVPAVYSSLPPYVDVVRDGHTGLLADDSTAAWVHALEMLLNDAPCRERIAGEARREVRERLDDKKVHSTFKHILTDLLNHRAKAAAHACGLECPA
jgi:ADP-heptose:LPS heptosyltransferase/GT2 family glycosyltransferase